MNEVDTCFINRHTPRMFAKWGGGGGGVVQIPMNEGVKILEFCTAFVWVIILSLPLHMLPSLIQSTQETPCLTSCFMLEPEFNKMTGFPYHPM